MMTIEMSKVYTVENEIRSYRNERTGEEFCEYGWDSSASYQAWEIAKATGDRFHIVVINAITGEVLRETEMVA